MQNIIKKYRKHKLLSNLNIVLVSLVMAFWINFLLIDWTDLGQNLKTSVLNTKIKENNSDLSVQKIKNSLYIISNTDINNINSLSLSLTYNSENLNILDISSNYWDLVNLTNTPWINSIILTTEKPIDINLWDKLIKINISKSEEKTENLNILNANFKDINWEHFLLSTSWITF